MASIDFHSFYWLIDECEKPIDGPEQMPLEILDVMAVNPDARKKS